MRPILSQMQEKVIDALLSLRYIIRQNYREFVICSYKGTYHIKEQESCCPNISKIPIYSVKHKILTMTIIKAWYQK